MSSLSVFSKIKHRGMTHSNFLLTVTIQSLAVENMPVPEFLFFKWSTTRQKGMSKSAIVSGKKASWDETFTLRVTFYNYPGNPMMEKKFLNLRLVHRSAKKTVNFGTVDIELTQFANIDGERSKVFPVTLDGGPGAAQLSTTIKTLWINDGSNMPNRLRNATNMSQMSLTSITEVSDKGDSDSFDWTDEGEDFTDDKQKIASDALSWLSPTHPNPERGEHLMQIVSYNLTAEDVLFLMNQLAHKEQEKVMMAVRAKSEIPHPKIKEKSMSGIPGDLLYAIMNKADVGSFLSERMRHNPTQVEGYLNQLCSLVLFCNKEFPRLESFLLQTCGVSTHFALQVYWFFVAALGRKAELDDTLQQQAMRLKIAILSSVEGPSSEILGENFKHFQDELALVESLVKIGKEICSLPHEKRKDSLVEGLTKLNETFKESSARRVYIPLCNSHDPRKYIIRFVPEHCVVFGTAHRAPFLVFAEAFEEQFAHPFPKIVITGTEEDLMASPATASNGSPSESDRKAMKLELKRQKEEKKKQEKSEVLALSREASLEKITITPRKERPGTPRMGEREREEKEKEREKEKEKEKEKEAKEKEKDKKKDKGKGKDKEKENVSEVESSEHDEDSEHKDGANDNFSNTVKEKLLGKLMWSRKVEAIKSASPYGNDPRWHLVSAIVKSGDDLRQEKLAVQLIDQIYSIFLEFKLPLFIHPYKVLATSSEDGMIETVTNAMTLDSIKQIMGPNATLLEYFRLMYGSEGSRAFKIARENFVQSMAAYSLVCYMLQIKDRHNGNIMLDADGHIIHIDFGFMLSKKQIRLLNVNFEAAPFKLTQEFIDIMGGTKSSSFKTYKHLMQKGYRKLRKRHYKLTMLVDIVASTTDLPCLTDKTTAELESRFNLYMSKKQSNKFISSQIKEAMRSTTTRTYDLFNEKRFGIRR